MTKEEFGVFKRNTQKCIKYMIPVKINIRDVGGEYLPIRMGLYYHDNEWKYDAELIDVTAKNSLIRVPLTDLIFPESGGGIKLEHIGKGQDNCCEEQTNDLS